MRIYNTEFIKQYIESNKEEIESVACGMREDWSWTTETIYEDGEFNPNYDFESELIYVAGIHGSTWATPIMEVNFNDGRTEIVECWLDDGNKASSERIALQKAFALATSGMDYRL